MGYKLDHTTKMVGDIGICSFHEYKGIEMQVIERFNAEEDIDLVCDDDDTEHQVWLKRSDGKIFNKETDKSSLRKNKTECLFHEFWLMIAPEWDKENNNE